MSAPARTFYGGQAVLEGVMMRGRSTYAVAVRRADGGIELVSEPIPNPLASHRLWRKPFLRGLAVVVESMRLGLRALLYSAQVSARDQGVEMGGGMGAGTVAVALLIGVGLFVLTPAVAVSTLTPHLGWLSGNLLEGVIRGSLLIGYLALIGRLPGVDRLFAYHGAEHKVINAFEAGSPLEVGSVQSHSRLHPRCGTGFLVVVIIVSLVVFSLAGRPPLGLRLLSRLVLTPLVLSFSYELVRYVASHPRGGFARLLLPPVLASQRLTTREPGDGEVEVALRAFTAMRAAEAAAPQLSWEAAPEVVA